MKSTIGRIDLTAGLALLMIFCVLSAVAHATSRDQAKRIHDRLAGVPPDDATLTLMAAEIDRGDAIGAAMRATAAPEFYSVTLKNFATPWTNRARSIYEPLNDYTATVIGMVRDELDFRLLLSGDIIYTGSGPGVPGYSPASNAHYAALESTAADLQDVLQRQSQAALTGLPADATAGVLTTRAAARAYFIAGTNRAMFRFTLVNHLCRDLEQVMDLSRPPDRIRQDVSRSPGGDSRVFLNNCIGCHAGMDPLAQAFAYYDYVYDRAADPEGDNGFIRYNGPGDVDPVTGKRVVAKYFNNASTFPYGFVTPDDSWSNYWREGPNGVVGWDGALPGSGQGARALGEELAHSDAFAQCQVEKVFAKVCLRPPQDAGDHAEVERLVSAFSSQGYNLKRVFAAAAVFCMGD